MIEVVREIGRAPVNERGNRAHESGHERCHDQAEHANRQKFEHHDRVAELGIFQLRIEHHCRQRHENPWPRADDVVHDIEEPGGFLGLGLIAGGRHALDELAAAIRAAERPPLHEHVGEERRRGNPRDGTPADPPWLGGIEGDRDEGEDVEIR